jgi:hypothetical protein
VERREWSVERDDAGAADEELDIGLLKPAFGFGGFEFEFGDGFDGVAGGEDFGAVAVELLGEVHGAGEGAVGFSVEAGGDGFDRVGEEGVVLGGSMSGMARRDLTVESWVSMAIYDLRGGGDGRVGVDK